MSDLRKSAEMALETLEEINKLSIGEKAICLPAEIDDAMEALRQALAHQALDEMVAENQRLGLYDDAVNMTQERVDETAKGEHEPVVKWDASAPLVLDRPHCGHCCQKREWVGLTQKEVFEGYESEMENKPFNKYTFAVIAGYIEAKLREKNT